MAAIINIENGDHGPPNASWFCYEDKNNRTVMCSENIETILKFDKSLEINISASDPFGIEVTRSIPLCDLKLYWCRFSRDYEQYDFVAYGRSRDEAVNNIYKEADIKYNLKSPLTTIYCTLWNDSRIGSIDYRQKYVDIRRGQRDLKMLDDYMKLNDLECNKVICEITKSLQEITLLKHKVKELRSRLDRYRQLFEEAKERFAKEKLVLDKILTLP